MLEKLYGIVKENAGCPWPEGGSNRGTLYPNLLAESANSGYSLRTLAEHAHVSMEIMARILDDQEEIYLKESARLIDLFSVRHTNEGYGYLFAESIRTICPDSENGKRCVCQLQERLANEDHSPHTVKAEHVLEKLSGGEVISFALYRQAVANLDLAANGRQNADPPRTVRACNMPD